MGELKRTTALAKKGGMMVLDGAVETEKGIVQSELGSVAITQTDFQHILDNVQDIVVVLDTNLNVIYVNRAAESVTGYGAELFGEQFFSCIHTDDRDELIRLVEDACEHDEQGQVECRILSMSGEEKWMLVRYQPFHDKTEDQERLLVTFVDITERRQREDGLKRKEQEWRSIVEDVPDTIMRIDRESKIEFINHAAPGHTIEEAIGRNVFEYYVPVEYRESMKRSIEQAIETKDFITCEIIAGPNDYPLWYSIRIGPVISDGEIVGVSLTARDITLRKQMEDELRESEEKFRAISDLAQDAVIVADSRGRISFWNPAATRLFGHTLAEVEGKDLHQVLVPERYREAAKKGLAGFSESGTGNVVGKTVELKALRRDGTEFPVGLSLSSVRLRGEWHAVAMVRDITEQQKSREQLMQSDRLAAIGTLAAGVAHEINNPIGYINSNLNTMKKYLGRINKYFENAGSQNEDAQQNIEDILTDFGDAIDESVEGTNRVKQIVADLKSFSRVDRAEKESTDINEGLRSTLNIVWNELKYKAKVETELGDLPDLFCMPNQLNQVFMNILVNAGHAIDGNDGQITMKSWADEINIYVSIKDNGSGMPESVQKRIFEPFFTTKDVGKGTGLGLSLVHDIIEKHGGKIEVKSQVGVGTVFVVILPLRGIDEGKDRDTNGR
jgi:two-component system NtrC family sensor kinase